MTDELGELKVKALPALLQYFESIITKTMEAETNVSSFNTMKVSPQEETHIN